MKRLTTFAEPARQRRGLECLQVLLFSAALLMAMQVSVGNAHGTHVRFLEPDHEETVSENLDVRIARAPHSFPYVYVEIQPYLHPWARQVGLSVSESKKWSGLVPIGEADYFHSIDVSGWAPGRYVIEAQYVGDYVVNIQSRQFVVEQEEK